MFRSAVVVTVAAVVVLVVVVVVMVVVVEAIMMMMTMNVRLVTTCLSAPTVRSKCRRRLHAVSDFHLVFLLSCGQRRSPCHPSLL